MAFRRVFVVLPVTGAMVVAFAMPAAAVPVGCTTVTRGTTAIQVCLDQTGTSRGAHVSATSSTQPIVMVVHRIWVDQCNNGGVPTSCSTVYEDATGYTVTGFGVVTTTKGAYTASFGHTYRGCATVSVSNQFYNGTCSQLIPN